MSASRSIYKIFRSLIFTAVLSVIGIFVCLYVTLSVPSVQNKIRAVAEKELSEFLGGKVEIGSLNFHPFNELSLYEVSFYTPEGARCISVGKIGAGISLWTLLTEYRFEISYAEIISLNAKIIQPAPESPLNIDYLIQALSSKDKNKPPAKFDILLRNIVIRKSAVSFDRTFIPTSANLDKFDANHIHLSDFKADIAFPKLKNDEISIDIRRLAFTEQCGLNINSLSLQATYTPQFIAFSNFRLRLADSSITLSDQRLDYTDFKDIKEAALNKIFNISVQAAPLILSDFACFLPALNDFSDPCSLSVNIRGKLSEFDLESFRFEDFRNESQINVMGYFYNLTDFRECKVADLKCSINSSSAFVQRILKTLGKSDVLSKINISPLGGFSVDVSGDVDFKKGTASLISEVSADCLNLGMKVDARGLNQKSREFDFSIKAKDVSAAEILNINNLGPFSLESSGFVSVSGSNVNGHLDCIIPSFIWNGRQFENITVNLEKQESDYKAILSSANPGLDFNSNLELVYNVSDARFVTSTTINNLQPALFGIKGFNLADSFEAEIEADIKGTNPDNLNGSLAVNDFKFGGEQRNFSLSELLISIDDDSNEKIYSVESDFISGLIKGNLPPTRIIGSVQKLLGHIAPSFFKHGNAKIDEREEYLNYNLQIRPSDSFFNIIKTPVRPGVPINISGNITNSGNNLLFDLEAPYLIQGKNKLLRNTNVLLEASCDDGAKMSVSTDIPVKNDRAVINADIIALNDTVNLGLNWQGVKVKENSGELSLQAALTKTLQTPYFAADVVVRPSSFSLHGAKWNIFPSFINFTDKKLEVNGLKIVHGNQYVDIYGRASDSPLDILNVNLSEINLDYVFGILNIDHVDFGGIATGRAYASSIFSKSPVARTDGLIVTDLAYNDCVLGNGVIESHWDNETKMVAINADIAGPENSSATVRGGVYVTRDSLSFDFGARHLDIDFLQPFMSGFSSKVNGHASGNVKLFGTFSDIDLIGKVHADDIRMLVDHTNVTYAASDSLFFYPGRISIPGLKLYDKFGNSGNFKGHVEHNYLKDASFSFNLTDAHNLLVYDTDKKDNNKWYGTIFANGSASIKGVPGLVSVSVDMSTAPNSEFTLELDETEEAAEYTFLTFSDNRKKEAEMVQVEESFEDMFYKNSAGGQDETPTAFVLGLSLDVTPDANLVIVMDPDAGDKITAVGFGALQMKYDTCSDNLSIYGKYTLNNGWYNFSLQDLILKNFKIEAGSNISFNGDPLRGVLDITAAYRVNTNLKDLANSFASDPDLNRTFVPVDALLKVRGDIHAPEIKFDIDLPTVTSEVKRKVMSIISSEDMLNRQVIYLLALNRFYSPEYSGVEQGSEIASVASVTLSSQIQNIIGSLTDRFTLAPSFKTEKSDLSDMEVDLALSSSFFDNRLLVNGNLGYRDKSTSQTTFIGDFDLEYLLSRDGKLRLKAYNHFNDASYYLKSALTTQGIGIVYRKDFDDPLKFIKSFLRRKRKNTKVLNDSSIKNDSVQHKK